MLANYDQEPDNSDNQHIPVSPDAPYIPPIAPESDNSGFQYKLVEIGFILAMVLVAINIAYMLITTFAGQ